MVLCCNRHGGGYLSLRIALGVVSGREIGALIEASGTFEDRVVERRHLAGFVSVREEKLVLCGVGRLAGDRDGSRERHFRPNEAGA